MRLLLISCNILNESIALSVINQFSHSYNHFHNILKLLYVLPNFPFTTSEMMRNYYL